MLSSLIIQQGTAGNDGPPGPPGERVSATQNALQRTFLSHHTIYSEMVYGLKCSERVLLQEAQWGLAQYVGVLQIRGLTTRPVFSSGSYYRFMKSSWAFDYWKAVVQGSHHSKSDVALFVSAVKSCSWFFLYLSVFSCLFFSVSQLESEVFLKHFGSLLTLPTLRFVSACNILYKFCYCEYL